MATVAKFAAGAKVGVAQDLESPSGKAIGASEVEIVEADVETLPGVPVIVEADDGSSCAAERVVKAVLPGPYP